MLVHALTQQFNDLEVLLETQLSPGLITLTTTNIIWFGLSNMATETFKQGAPNHHGKQKQFVNNEIVSR